MSVSKYFKRLVKEDLDNTYSINSEGKYIGKRMSKLVSEQVEALKLYAADTDQKVLGRRGFLERYSKLKREADEDIKNISSLEKTDREWLANRILSKWMNLRDALRREEIPTEDEDLGLGENPAVVLCSRTVEKIYDILESGPKGLPCLHCGSLMTVMNGNSVHCKDCEKYIRKTRYVNLLAKTDSKILGKIDESKLLELVLSF